MTDVLVVVDMQRDFIDGVLGSKEACSIVPSVVHLIEQFEGVVFYTMDTHDAHYLETEEGKHLPIVHCIKETPGWRLHPEVEQALLGKRAIKIEKPTFGSLELMSKIEEIVPTSLMFIGVCTDICVMTNAMLAKTYFSEIPIRVVSSACAASTPDKQSQTFAIMKSCHIEIEE